MTNEPALVIRDYRPADLDSIVELNAYGLAAAGIPADADVYRGDLDDIAGTFLTGRNTMLVGELADTVVAMGALTEVDFATCEITRMRVAPGVHGRGYGSAILGALEEHARRLGYDDAILLTGPDQHPAIDLYTRRGYAVTAIEHHGQLIGVRMHKKLDTGAANGQTVGGTSSP